MKKTNGKYILIFLLSVLWLGLVIWLYVNNKEESLSETDSALGNYSTEAYSDEELKQMAQKMNTVSVSDAAEIIQGNFVETPLPNNQLQDDFSFTIDSNDIVAVTLPRENPATITPEPNKVNGESVEGYREDDLFRSEQEEENIPEPEPEPEPVEESITNKSLDEGNNCGGFPCYTSAEFLDIYNSFEELDSTLDFFTKYIYQIPEVDDYIKSKAEERGYRQRGFAKEEYLVWFENVRTRKPVRDAYIAMRNEMLQENIRLHFVSGYRSSSSQRYIFKNKMNIGNPIEITTGIHDAVLNTVLSRSSIPGYSKHHSGYAVDFGCGNDYLVYAFADTECYDWMSTNNFENAKKYGFIPSYPNGVDSQGPNPEPWEYVWVGTDNLK